MKPSYRYYNADKGARFTSGEQELVLRKNDLFRLELYQGHPCVIKDGVVYEVNKKLVSELTRRSEKASVTQVHKARSEFLNLYGIDIEKALVKNTKKLIDDLSGTDVQHKFVDSQAWLTFVTGYDERPERIRVMFAFNGNSIGVSVYASSKEAFAGWKALPVLQVALRKFGKYLTEKFDLTISKPVVHTATYGNIRVAGKPFSGKTWSYSANWDF